MAQAVIWTDAAWSDLQDIAEYIAEDSRVYAAAFVRDARDAGRSLANFAARGRVVPERGEPAIRELFVGSYRLIYQATVPAVPTASSMLRT